MAANPLKIVSLLPSTTEIVCALGLQDRLVGRSHECDYPAAVKQLPSCTEPKFTAEGTSCQIDERVRTLLREGLSVYRVDDERIADLRPDVIITQDHCEVCAASLPEVERAVAETLGYEPEIVSVSPSSMEGVFESVKVIADALNRPAEGDKLVRSMKSGLDAIHAQCRNLPTRSLVAIEWLDPLMTGGNWMPELAEIAGCNSMGASAGEHSPWFSWEKLLSADPDLIAILPCGYSIDKTLDEIGILTGHGEWQQLRAVRESAVYVLEGNQYFNRPGPRLVDSAEILTEIAHPEVFPASHHRTGWIRLEEHSEYMRTAKISQP